MSDVTLLTRKQLETLHDMQNHALVYDDNMLQYYAYDVAIYAGMDSKPLLRAALERTLRQLDREEEKEAKL